MIIMRDEILKVFKDSDDVVLATPMIAELVNNGVFDSSVYNTVRKELNRMEIDNVAKKRKVQQTNYWMIL